MGSAARIDRRSQRADCMRLSRNAAGLQRAEGGSVASAAVTDTSRLTSIKARSLNTVDDRLQSATKWGQAMTRILDEVAAALASEPLIGSRIHHIERRLEDGAVVLEGEVPTIAAKRKALEHVAAVAGFDGIIEWPNGMHGASSASMTSSTRSASTPRRDHP